MFGFGATPQLGTGLTAGGGQLGLMMPQGASMPPMGGAQGLLAGPTALSLQAPQAQIDPRILQAGLAMMQSGQSPAPQSLQAPQAPPRMGGGNLHPAALQSMFPYMMAQGGMQPGGGLPYPGMQPGGGLPYPGTQQGAMLPYMMSMQGGQNGY